LNIPRLDRLRPEEQQRVRELFHALDWNVARGQECETTGRRDDAAHFRQNVKDLHNRIQAIMREADRRLSSADGD
jgi:hypothetical protein